MQKYNLQKNPVKENQNPSTYYNSITNLKFQHKPKYQKCSYKNRSITQGPKSLKLLYSIMNLNTIFLPTKARPKKKNRKQETKQKGNYQALFNPHISIKWCPVLCTFSSSLGHLILTLQVSLKSPKLNNRDELCKIPNFIFLNCTQTLLCLPKESNNLGQEPT